MGFSFLNPWFLAGLAALAVPVLIHLVQRQNPAGQMFPSLMFLRQIPYRERRRREIRHWLLLLLRCLAVALLVLAFARPFIAGFTDGTALSDDRLDRVIVLDRSYSMAYAERWRDAQQAALAALDELAPGDRSALILFDQKAQAVADLGAGHETARSALRNYQPGPGATHYRVALDQAARLLAQSDARRREVMLISDFQQLGYPARDAGQLQLPPGVTLIHAEAPAATAANASLTAITLQPKQHNGQEIVELSAQIGNTGDQPIETLTITLRLDGHEVDKRELNLAADSVESISFELAPAIDVAVQGTLQLGSDGLEQDNAYYFVLLPAPKLPLLVVESFGARENQSLFLQRALDLSRQPGFQIEIGLLDALPGSAIDNRAVVVLNDVPIPGGEPGDRLRAFVEAGGGLLVIAADRLQGGWPGGAEGYLPGSLGRRVERRQQHGAHIGQLDFSHPLLEIFSDPRNGSLAGAQIFQYRQLTPAATDRVLARYDDAGVALIERKVGAGRVLVLTTTLDSHWNTLALQPVFVPFMHRLMSYLAAYQATPAWFSVGDVVDIGRHAHTLLGSGSAGPEQDLIVEAPSGEQYRLQGADKLLSLDEHGFYEVHATSNNDAKLVIASNIDTRESDFSTLDAAAFVENINSAAAALALPGVTTDGAAIRAAQRDSDSVPEQEKRQQLWWYLLLAAALVLVLETLMSNRLSAKPQQL